MNPLRRQLPVHSPLPVRAVLAAFGTADRRVQLAEELRRLYLSEHVELLDSGTSALAIALRFATALKPGGYCLLPAYGCYDLVSAALAAQVRVVFYDLDPRTLAPRADSILPLLGSRCAAVVVVAHYGLPVDLTAIRRAAKDCDAVCIEDMAQAAGAFWDGQRAGASSDAAVLSFGRGKGVTGGGGGALLIGPKHAEQFRATQEPIGPPRSGGWRRLKLLAQFVLARPVWYGIPANIPVLRLGETIFRSPSPPAAMPQTSIRTLCHTLPQMDTEAAARARVADALRKTQESVAPETLVLADSRATPGWLRLPILATSNQAARLRAAGRLGVAPGYPRTLPSLPEAAGLVELEVPTPGADSLSQRLWTLPTHSVLTDQDRSDLIGLVSESR